MRVSSAVAEAASKRAQIFAGEGGGEYLVRSVNWHLDGQRKFPAYNALRAMGAVWDNDTQMRVALDYAIGAWLDGEGISEAAQTGARIVLKQMIQEAGLKQVREGGERVWRKPDPAYLDQAIAGSENSVAGAIEQTAFGDPADLDRLERESAEDQKAERLNAIFEKAVQGIKPMELPEGINLLDAMHIVGRLGSRAAARQLGVDRTTLNNRWATFQRRVIRIMKEV